MFSSNQDMKDSFRVVLQEPRAARLVYLVRTLNEVKSDRLGVGEET